MDIPAAGLDKADIETTVREAVGSTLGKSTFIHNKVDGWIAKVMETCLKRLAQSAKQYKYVVSCQIMQNAGAGSCVTSTYSWDPRTDDCITVDWQNDHILCIVSVYWLAV
ncbi:Tctex-type light chain of dynein [Chloropicon primus]|uniref:Tctex-type light chain of dynein n=1 Tax=Chloropicon primus TaxID=1764295 RepID=A0A5B8MHW7_9CHLO|nr:Tctex-type light chain of dynein [Chloropicon primus]UPQ99255.1 Tctex-type light chain of dynein [Chloropicon primus]|eukprot:QDZ20043.1 Tctex-type light chain of dynein [Chloropicon primus]